MCGTPQVSRVIRTGEDRPAAANVPDTWAVRGGGGEGAWRHALMVPSARAAQRIAAFLRSVPAADTLALMTIKDSLLTEYDHEVGTTRKLLERVPDAQLGWKPHEKSMSLGGLATHLANIPNWAGALLNQSAFDLSDAPPNLEAKASRAEILEAFDASTRQARQWMDKADAEYVAPWTLKRGGQAMFSMPRVAAFRSFVISHMIHHRGQLSVYLRMHNVPVPSIYGPSADEG